jgi:hypothetical protein
MVDKLESLEEKIKTTQGIDSYGGTKFADLCFFSDIKLPHKPQIFISIMEEGEVLLISASTVGKCVLMEIMRSY